jgi:hypothetical protein
MPGWYPDPTGAAGQAYWNGREWGSSPPKPPFDRRILMIVGSIVGGVVLLAVLGNIGNDGDSAKPTASTVTRTVTVTAQPTMATVTVTAAAPLAPFFESPAPVSEPPFEAPLVPQIPSSAYYGSCAAARAAGAAPLHVGDPGYRSGLGRDDDGVACE